VGSFIRRQLGGLAVRGQGRRWSSRPVRQAQLRKKALFMNKLILVVSVMVLFFTIGFLVADHLSYMDPKTIQAWFDSVERSGYGRLAIGGIIAGLLAVDLVLPIPSSVIMAISGMLLGVWTGGIASFLGAMLSACAGFLLCRWGGHTAFRRLIGQQDTHRIDRWFDRYGVYAIIISRPIPMLTEILSCLAGLAGLSFRSFLLASILGTLPICFIYSYVGSFGDITNPWPAIWIALLIPALGWVVVRRIRGG